MSITMFLLIFTIGAAVASLLTESVKKFCQNGGLSYSANGIALINAIIVGGLGTCFAYVIINIPFTLTNIVCIILMVGCVWIGSMIGYDKVVQLITQMGSIKKEG